MAPLIEQHRDALVALCHEYHVLRLEVFGSAATDAFDPERSDVDLLVEFDVGGGGISPLTQYIGFQEAVEALLGRSVDIVNPAYITNRFFREGVDATRQPIYAAPTAGAPAGRD